MPLPLQGEGWGGGGIEVLSFAEIKLGGGVRMTEFEMTVSRPSAASGVRF
jgi:hypothetical protein